MTWVTTVKLCKDFWEETSKDTSDIAAALAFLAGGEKPLFYDSMPKIESKRSAPREDRRDRRDRGEGKNSLLGIMIDPKESHSGTIISKAIV